MATEYTQKEFDSVKNKTEAPEFKLFIKEIEKFEKTMPTDMNTSEKLSIEEKVKLYEFSKETRPIIHKKINVLIDDFLNCKRMYGSSVERNIYSKMTREEFICRLFAARPQVFYNDNDTYKLRDGTQGHGGFEKIGTEEQKPPLIMENYLSYDEMQISALLGTASKTFFINNGNRNNLGIGESSSDGYQREGVQIGAVGARFEKPGLMEWQHMMVTKDQNQLEKGYGVKESSNPLLNVWGKFYGLNEGFPTINDVEKHPENYIDCGNGLFLNKAIYKERLRMSIEPCVFEAEERAKREDKKAFLHVIGLGLGVWAVNGKEQAKIMMEVYKELLEKNTFTHISDINFSWFPDEAKVVVGISEKDSQIEKNGINLKFSKREPSAKLTGNDQDKLLVAMFAWDGNSCVGNEYWLNKLAASGDPAAVCSSYLAQLTDPSVNPHYLGKGAGVHSGSDPKISSPSVRKSAPLEAFSIEEDRLVVYDKPKRKEVIQTQLTEMVRAYTGKIERIQTGLNGRNYDKGLNSAEMTISCGRSGAFYIQNRNCWSAKENTPLRGKQIVSIFEGKVRIEGKPIEEVDDEELLDEAFGIINRAKIGVKFSEVAESVPLHTEQVINVNIDNQNWYVAKTVKNKQSIIFIQDEIAWNLGQGGSSYSINLDTQTLWKDGEPVFLKPKDVEFVMKILEGKNDWYPVETSGRGNSVQKNRWDSPGIEGLSIQGLRYSDLACRKIYINEIWGASVKLAGDQVVIKNTENKKVDVTGFLYNIGNWLGKINTDQVKGDESREIQFSEASRPITISKEGVISMPAELYVRVVNCSGDRFVSRFWS